jgi:hypothetical protein
MHISGVAGKFHQVVWYEFSQLFFAFAERKALNMMARKELKFCECTLHHCAFLNKQGKGLNTFASKATVIRASLYIRIVMLLFPLT